MSRNTLDALERTNQGHQLLAMKAIGLIADSSMSFHSAEGRDAYYLNVRGDLAIHAHLNDQARYDVISISASTGEPIFLSVPPPATPHSQAPSIMSAQASSNSRLAQHPRSNLLQASIEQHNPQDFTGTSPPSSASVSSQPMAFAQDGATDASVGVPGPDRTRPRHATRTEPYPASPQLGDSLMIKGVNSTRVQDPDNPGKMITLGTLRRRERVADPDNPGQTLSKGALSARKYHRQQVEDPENQGQTISRAARNKRRRVEDPENSGQTISLGMRIQRQQLLDPENPEKTTSRSALATRKYDRQKITDPENPTKTISRSTLASREYGRQRVEDPEHQGQTISRAALKSRRHLARVAAEEAENV